MGHKWMWNPKWGGLPPQAFLSKVDPLLDGIREKIGGDELKKSLKDLGLADGELFKRALLDQVEQELRRQYYSNGFYDVDIKTTVTEVPPLWQALSHRGPSAVLSRRKLQTAQSARSADLAALSQLETALGLLAAVLIPAWRISRRRSATGKRAGGRESRASRSHTARAARSPRPAGSAWRCISSPVRGPLTTSTAAATSDIAAHCTIQPPSTKVVVPVT